MVAPRPSSIRPGVLLIHPGTLGDVLLARPAIALLRRQFPEHELALVSAEAVGQVLLHAHEIDRLFSLERNHLGELYAGEQDMTGEFQIWLSRCVLGIAWLSDADERIQRTLHEVGVQTVVMKSPASSDLASLHQTARFIETILGSEGGAPIVSRLTVSEIHKGLGCDLLSDVGLKNQSGLVAVHVGSGSRHKCLSPAVLSHVVGQLSEEGKRPFLLAGPADGESLQAVRTHMRKLVPAIEGAELAAVAGLLSMVDLYVGHDSGLTHLAAAVGRPTVACFGPTDAQRWRPLGEHVRTVIGPRCVCSSWSTVQACRDKPCLAIPPEQILAACREISAPW